MGGTAEKFHWLSKKIPIPSASESVDLSPLQVQPSSDVLNTDVLPPSPQFYQTTIVIQIYGETIKGAATLWTVLEQGASHIFT